MSKVGHNIWLGAEGCRGVGGVAGAKGCPDSLEQNRSLGDCIQWKIAIVNGLITKKKITLSNIDFHIHDCVTAAHENNYKQKTSEQNSLKTRAGKTI